MKLKKIKVEQLFGTYDYEIKLNDKELVTILHAPNGMGKTTLLHIRVNIKDNVIGNNKFYF